MTRIGGILGTLLIALTVAAPALAHDFRGRTASSSGQTSVFPTPRDPWRSWGVERSDQRRQVHPPHQHVAPPSVVWVPGRWVWDGVAWTWWPGRWERY